MLIPFLLVAMEPCLANGAELIGIVLMPNRPGSFDAGTDRVWQRRTEPRIGDCARARRHQNEVNLRVSQSVALCQQASL